MKKTCLLLATFIVLSKVFSQDINVYFNFNSATLRMNDVDKLHSLIKEYKAGKFDILLSGHTDTVGNKSFNDDLSKKRVEAIKTHLLKEGVAKENIKISFFGEIKTVSSDQFYNRRVEIYKQQNNSGFASYQEFVNHIAPKKETFEIPTGQTIKIEGKKGTLITIPPNSFQYKNGKPVTGSVKVELTEYYTFSDFISHRLSTIADGNLLTTNGMVNIKATKDTTEVFLKDTSEIELAFPKSSNERFYTFYGEQLEDGRMNWKLDEKLWERKQHDIGVIPSEDGKSLIITDKKTADETNKLIVFDRDSQTFKRLTPKEKEEYDKYLEKRRIEFQENLKEQRKSDSLQNKYYTFLQSRKLRWINCDEFIRDPSSTITNYYVTVDDNDIRILNVFLIFKRNRALLELSAKQNNIFHINARLPLKAPTELMIIGIKGAQVFVYHEKVELSDGRSDIPTLKETSYSDLEKKLKGLNLAQTQ